MFILTDDIIIQKSQTVNPVRCCHASILIRELEYGFKRPRAGGKGEMSQVLNGQQWKGTRVQDPGEGNSGVCECLAKLR